MRFVIGIIIILLIDFYFYQAIILLTHDIESSKRILIRIVYWGITAFTIGIVITLAVVPLHHWTLIARNYLLPIAGILLICKLLGSVFILFDDLGRLIRWLYDVSTNHAHDNTPTGTNTSRLKFLNQLAVAFAIIPLSAFVYGMIKSGFDYKVRKVKLKLPKLPTSFNGLKILHISDIHIGSFVSGAPLNKALEIIKKQEADIVFFTGDLVNNVTDEAFPYIGLLEQIKAPMGVFSTLGNHDYGDYVQWPSVAAKKENMKKMIDLHERLGWRLLMNEHVILQKQDASIAVLGVENWGAAMRFPKYGKLDKAYQGTEKYPVKLLLSHDPSHWDAQIRKEYPDIDVTFSGHTHGMQFGVEIPGFKWSPSQYLYKQWAGLYRKKNQSIYVNRGLGFIGYPGRVGILPEITVFELYKS
ncbi:MAG: metallophosphoesterase [Bacteroidia bacterium]|nr:metallophosphoesterase [Bacteroidia bacterium]MCZ2247613.1 metallophosphoesterase [Bacteroidia bacterium]